VVEPVGRSKTATWPFRARPRSELQGLLPRRPKFSHSIWHIFLGQLAQIKCSICSYQF
jgi:hypothetical protein